MRYERANFFRRYLNFILPAALTLPEPQQKLISKTPDCFFGTLHQPNYLIPSFLRPVQLRLNTQPHSHILLTVIMKILTINFGHDASLGIFDGGKLEDFVEVERESRLKHHFGLATPLIEGYLSRVGYSFEDIDLVVLSGTQQWGMFHDDRVAIAFGYTRGLHDSLGIEEEAHWNEDDFNLYLDYAADYYGSQVEQQKLKPSPSPVRTRWAHNFPTAFCERKRDIGAVASHALTLDNPTKQNLWSYFLTPYSFSLDETKKPALYVDHHFAHANYAWFYTDELSLSVTHDGGVAQEAFNTGGVYILVPEGGVIPIMSHGLSLGKIYDEVAKNFKLDAGKLMGLASYGRPNRFVGSVAEKYMEKLHFGYTMTTRSTTLMLLGASVDQYR